MTVPLIFSGRSNHILAQELAKEMGTRVGDVQIDRFLNDEARLYVNERHVGERAIVIQSLSQPVDQHIIEFGLLCDALYRMGVQDLIAVIPWLAYSKQDKVFRDGEPLSVKVIAKMLQVVPVKRLYTFDLHNLAILGFFDIPVVNLSARQLFIDYFNSRIKKNILVAAPDAGAIKSSTSFAQAIGVQVVYIDKKRDLVTGNVKIMGISRNVKGKEIIIIDDMIVTGGTMIETVKFLKSKGAVKITIGSTHHLYVSGAQKHIEDSGVDEVIVTNTIEPRLKSDKLKILSVAPLIAGAVRAMD